MDYKDYYAILEVPHSATPADIKKAFRRLARKYHPDVNKGDAAAERRFKEINEANEVLGDTEKRRAYDALGADWAAYQGAGAGPFGDFARQARPGGGGVRYEFRGNAEDASRFSDFFQAFFGGAATGAAGATGGARAGTRARTSGISFEEILGGLGIDEQGATFGAASGARQAAASAPPDAEAEAEVTVDEVFHGTVRLLEVDGRRYEVKIPAGVPDGQRIRLGRKGRSGPGGRSILVRVKVLPSDVFERAGADLTRELPITLGEALLGAEIPIETIEGRRLLLRVPPESQNGRTIRLRGQGLPRFRAEGRGDLYARIRVVLPTGLDPEARTLATRFIEAARQPDPRTGRSPRKTAPTHPT